MRARAVVAMLSLLATTAWAAQPSPTFVDAARGPVPIPESTHPPLLRNALKDRTVLPDFSIDCVLDEVHKRFRVGRIGSETPIAKVYGFHPVSYPCINGLSYDYLVSEAYGKVVATGQPHYDHVIAAMTTPDGSVVWFPYQRVILPYSLPDGRRGVSVVSQVARVDIKIV